MASEETCDFCGHERPPEKLRSLCNCPCHSKPAPPLVREAPRETLADALCDLIEAVHGLRSAMSASQLAALPELVRAGLDLALVHAKRALEAEPAVDPTAALPNDIREAVRELYGHATAVGLRRNQFHGWLVRTIQTLTNVSHERQVRAETAEAQRTALIAALRELVEQWRDTAGSEGAIYASGIFKCADDLARLLPAQEPT